MKNPYINGNYSFSGKEKEIDENELIIRNKDKKIKILEKILDGVWDIYNDNDMALKDYSKAGKFAVEAYRIYISNEAKNKLMK